MKARYIWLFESGFVIAVSASSVNRVRTAYEIKQKELQGGMVLGLRYLVGDCFRIIRIKSKAAHSAAS